ncbi:E3 ubiquitin-protein ligase ZNF598 [Tribolium madens]|uniref:E3 ubiquitin-protein ligase ZNF598 n=1 Tax=Tribolium madens TaxID=41895 RepID=UPI001CF7321A|nr:E3 ubiquitin-protein ligase ZNF598 [Tribolium madens]
MSDPRENIVNSESENLCVVCCKTVEIYSVGICDHPVCFECSTRMRVLCNQNECPICRGQMPKVIFTKEVAPFATLFSNYQHTNLQDRKFGLIFCSEEIKKAYQQLLEFRCAICTKASSRKCTFYTFQQLKDHMRREHNLVYCDLCVENLKIFCFERRCYTRQELGYHRRKGDPDNTSHRGHPLCEFCDTRFMDSDELFRHLRRMHLFCHFCDADGKHQYYNSMEDLQKHFREEHHLCEEGECSNMPLTAVFRTDIDLKAHIATEHGRHLSKSANKQARTLEFEFTLAPRPGSDRNKRQTRIERSDEEGAVGYDTEPGGPGGGLRTTTLTPHDFPALGNSTVAVQSRPTTTVSFTSKLNTYNSDDFPALGGTRTPAVTITTDSASRKKGPGVTITRTLRGSSAQNLTMNPENFPRLGPPSNGTSTVHLSLNNVKNSAPNVSIHVNHNGAITTTHITSTSSHSNGFNINQRPVEAFPALGNTSVPLNPKWVQQKSKKQESRLSKVAPAPSLPPSDLTQFPTLKKNAMKSSSVTVPVSGTWPTSSNSNNNNTSKINKNIESSKNKKQKKKTGEEEKNKNEENKEKSKNGIVKKRSELNIGALSLDEARPTPPPGFSVKPPPGFNVSNQNFPSLGASNDLTFTSSSGQSYSIKPTNYHQPANFVARNQNLIKRAMNVLDGDTIKEFKSYSAKFREGAMIPEDYHEYCKALLGSSFKELFPELLVLLPDIEKQQDLYRVCDGDIRKNLIVCENCSQVIFKRELGEHYNYHALESQFPSLGKNVEATNAWRK